MDDAPAEQESSGGGTRMFHVYETDLAELERLIPSIADVAAFSTDATPRLRTQIRQVKKILSDIRWNYGPPEQVERIPC